MNKANIGIIGGSGLYDFFKGKPASTRGASPASTNRGESTRGGWIEIKTPYGKPSDKIFLTEYKGRKIAFLPRHGRGHKIPPHMINYRANIWAFKKLGVKVIISPAAVGSLQPDVKRGNFVICNDFIDRTRGRKDTFFNGPASPAGGPKVVHISSADCYCEKLRRIATEVCKKHKIRVHPKGTGVVIQGPRFSSKAESKWFTKMGWDVVNMTQYPEVVLAREAEICYVNISLITDYDAGLIGEKGIKPVSFDEIRRVFGQNIKNVKKVILDIIEKIPKNYKCQQCHQALKGAEV